MDKRRTKTMADRVFRDMAGAMAAGLAWLGTETGLFRVLAEHGPMNAAVLAQRSELVERYVEEWARGMVSAGYLDYDSDSERFSLPEEHAYLLASEGSDHFMGGLFGMVPPLMQVAPQVLEAFRAGGGVAFADFPPQCRDAIDRMNRGNYEHRLVDYWLAQLPEVGAKLTHGGLALDVGCGNGHVVAALARAFPASRVIGVDPDRESVGNARGVAVAAALERNTEFHVATLDQLSADTACDLVTLCDCLHDLPDPGAVLKDIHRRLTDDGVLLVIEPRAADRLEDNINPQAAMIYGFSVFHCMTQSLAREGAGLGACLGPQKTLALFGAAGFTRARQLDIRSPVNLFYAVQR